MMMKTLMMIMMMRMVIMKVRRYQRMIMFLREKLYQVSHF